MASAILGRFKKSEGTKMEELKINIYDENDSVIKEATAKTVDLRFGTIRRLMELLNVEDIEDTSQLLKTVYGAWGTITKILSKAFPEMTDEDWDGVKLGELLPIILKIIKYSLKEVQSIPTDSKNQTRA